MVLNSSHALPLQPVISPRLDFSEARLDEAAALAQASPLVRSVQVGQRGKGQGIQGAHIRAILAVEKPREAIGAMGMVFFLVLWH